MTEVIEKAKGWRTIALNVLIGVLVMLAEVASYLSVLNWREFMPPEYVGLVVIGVNVLNIIMRVLTTGPTPLREEVEKWRS